MDGSLKDAVDHVAVTAPVACNGATGATASLGYRGKIEGDFPKSRRPPATRLASFSRSANARWCGKLHRRNYCGIAVG